MENENKQRDMSLSLQTHNFILGPVDTDSISISKHDMSEFTEEEQNNLIAEINSMLPTNIRYSHDGYYKKVIVTKAKNYVLYDGKKITIKGSALKCSTKEPALKEFVDTIIKQMLNDDTNYSETYLKLVREINDIKDIKRWVSRKTISATTLSSERENEAKVVRALKDSDYKEGDRVYMYFTVDNELKLIERFTNDYCKDTLYDKLFKTAKVFETVLPIKEIFPNMSLKRNKKKLEEVLK